MQRLPSFTIAVTYRATDNLSLPRFPGSLWRGALGPALKDTKCVSFKQPCRDCRLSVDCLYPLFYEDLAVPRKGRGTPPRPFVLHIEWSSSPLNCRRGDLLGFCLTTFGDEVWQRLPYLVAALIRLGEKGIGAERTTLDLDAIDVLTPSGAFIGRIYEGGRLASPPEPLFWPEDSLGLDGIVAEAEIRLITPVNLERRGRHFDRELPFQELIRAVLRRRHELIETYGSGGLDITFKLREGEALALHLAEQVVVKEDRTRWQTHSRYSSRQKQRQSQSGLLGKVTYGGVHATLVDLLRFGVLTHVGGGSSMGMGAYALHTAGCSWPPPFWRLRNG